MRKFQIFYHVAVMNSWQQSHDIINSFFAKSDILENCDKIYYCVNGDLNDAKKYIGENKNVSHEFVHLRDDCTHYEFPTLNFLLDKSMGDDMNILYIHTKGASRLHNKRNGRNKHLDSMCYNCIWHYLECVNKLAENYDCVGLAYNNITFPHFSGNFWWAKSEHVRKLKKLQFGIRNFNDKEHPDRHDAEKWVCSVAGNFYNMHYEYKDSLYHGFTYADDDKVEPLIKLPTAKSELIDSLGFDSSKFKGLKAIESGGSSSVFDDLGVYQALSSCDNILFARDPSLLNRSAGDFHYSNKTKIGKLFWCDATDMRIFENDSYDVLLSSNNLEHIANPFKALYEWKRIIKNGGYIMLVLPRKESNFDHKRSVTLFDHLLDDYNKNVLEDDMTHLEEILSLHDLDRDPYAKPMSWFIERSKDNINHRCLHHHIFDTNLIQQIFDYMDFTTVQIVNDYRNFYALAKVKK